MQDRGLKQKRTPCAQGRSMLIGCLKMFPLEMGLRWVRGRTHWGVIASVYVSSMGEGRSGFGAYVLIE